MTENNYYKQILETLPDGIVLIDAMGRIELFNHSAEKMFGYSVEEITGKNISILVSENHALNHDAYLSTYLRTGIAKVVGKTNEVFARKKNGAEFPIDLSIGEIKNGSDTKFVGVFRDITNRKHSEAILIKAKQEADRNNKAKSEFISSISHELHTPLNAILGFANLLEHDASLASVPKNNAKKIYASGKRLMEIVDNLMVLAKIEAGQITLSNDLVDISKLMKKCLSQLRSETENKNIKIVKHIEQCKDYIIKTDKFRLEQVIFQILGNAIKYNSINGEIILSCSLSVDGMFSLSFKDTGSGIAHDKQEELFQAFNRLGMERGNIEGIGIGLTIASRLMKQMGGSIALKSQGGAGSEFCLQFPSSMLDFSKNKKIKKRLLVVEDNATNRELFKQQLAYLNYEVVVAEDGLEALDKLQNYDIDMILTDINMPNMDGHELTAAIRSGKNNIRSNLPIIAVTANIEESETKEGKRIGINDYLSKPVNLDELDKKLIRYFNTNASNVDRDTLGIDFTAETEHLVASVLVSTVGPDIDKHFTVLESYCVTSREAIDKIMIAYEKRDAAVIASQCHKIKSSSKAVGALELGRICQLLETAGKTQDWITIDDKITPLEDEFIAVEVCIRKYIDRFSGKEAISKDIRVLIVDDDRFSIDLIRNLLEQQGIHNIVTAMSGEEAVEVMRISTEGIGLMFCDLNMPTMDGIEIIRYLSEKNYSGGLALISGEDQRLLKSAENLAKARQLNLLGAIEKPLTNRSLDSILDSYQHISSTIAPTEKRAVVSLSHLQKAIRSKKIETYFQPKVDIKTRQLVGVEALARWKHSNKTVILPEAFINMAEENDLIDEITDLVFLDAFMHMKEWLKQGENFSLSLNISVNTLVKLDLPEKIVDYANQFEIPTKNLVLEITESRLMEDITSALDILTRMSLKGIKLSIDDFGTGYSSLEQLQRAPFSELKIDRSFVTDASYDKASLAILESSIGLAKKLDMVIVAEGVESKEDWDLLASLGADQAQGFLIAKPLPPKEFKQWLKEWREI